MSENNEFGRTGMSIILGVGLLDIVIGGVVLAQPHPVGILPLIVGIVLIAVSIERLTRK